MKSLECLERSKGLKPPIFEGLAGLKALTPPFVSDWVNNCEGVDGLEGFERLEGLKGLICLIYL